MKADFFVQIRFMSNEIERSSGLGAIHESCAAANELDFLNRLEGRNIIGFRIAKHICVDWHSILQYLDKLRTVRLQSAVTNTEERGRFFTQKQARSEERRVGKECRSR